MKTKPYRTSKKKDSSRKAKPLGYRYKGLDKSHPDYYKRPTAAEIQLFESGDKKMRKKIAYEDRPERSDSNQKNKLKKGGSIDVEFLNSNLFLVGKGHDFNGNYVVKIKFPNSNSFSIQTNGVLPKTHYNLKSVNKISELSDEQKSQIEKEVVDYISEYGTTAQKKKLKVYSGFDSIEDDLNDDDDQDDDNDDIDTNHEVGGDLWIQHAIKHKGVLREKAKSLGLIQGDENLSEEDLNELDKLGGVWSKRVALARTLKKMKDGGSVEKPIETPPVVVNKDEELKKYYGVEIPTHEMEILAERQIKWYESVINVHGYLFKKVFLQPFWMIQ